MVRNRKAILTLKICVFLIFIGRGYQYLFFDAPFRAVLWDESLLMPLVEGVFNVPWSDYVTSLKVDTWIQGIIIANGVLFVVAAISALLLTEKNRKYLRYPIVVGGYLLVLLSFLSMKDKFFHYAQFFEHAIQFGVPFVLLLAVKGVSLKKVTLYLKILIACTFTAHGLYALGYYPIPGYFIDLTISSFKVTEDTAVIILKAAGILDILVSIFIFVPKIMSYFLLYAFVWGILTALARIVSTINLDFISSSIHQTLYQVIYRLPHGLIPLLVVYIYRKQRIQSNNYLVNN